MGKKVLGRGLDALISDEVVNTEEILLLNIDEIEPNPLQPRFVFTEEEINTLAKSIKNRGVLQPIIVRKVNDKYQLIAGERRWRAAKKAGLERIPARVIEIDDNGALEIALVENLDRKDLNPLELAKGYQLLKNRFGLTQDEIAKKIGRSRSAVANTLRLLQLDDFVKDLIHKGKLTEGQARPLIGLPSDKQVKFAKIIVEKNLNSRQIEELVRREKSKSEKKESKDRQTSRIISKLLSEKLNYKVKVKFDPRGKSRLSIEFKNKDEFKEFLRKLIGEEIEI